MSAAFILVVCVSVLLLASIFTSSYNDDKTAGL